MLVQRVEKFLDVLARVGRPAEIVSNDTRGCVVRFTDGAGTIRLHWNAKPAFMSMERNGRMSYESQDFVGICNSMGYWLVPSPIAATAQRANYGHWIATGPHRDRNNQHRLLRFDGEPSPSHGFAVTWAEFKIGEPDAAPLTERPSIIIHEGGPGDGAQMRTFSVQLETQDRRVNEALGGDPYHVVVYAHGIAGACGAGVEKANDKWLRHRGWDVRDWVVTRVYGEVAGPGHPA